LISGDADSCFDQEIQVQQQTGIPSCTSIWIPEIAHMPPCEQPEAILGMSGDYHANSFADEFSIFAVERNFTMLVTNPHFFQSRQGPRLS